MKDIRDAININQLMLAMQLADAQQMQHAENPAAIAAADSSDCTKNQPNSSTSSASPTKSGTVSGSGGASPLRSATVNIRKSNSRSPIRLSGTLGRKGEPRHRKTASNGGVDVLLP